jgi:hypothetical protein
LFKKAGAGGRRSSPLPCRLLLKHLGNLGVRHIGRKLDHAHSWDFNFLKVAGH